MAMEVVAYQGKRFLRTDPVQKGKAQHESTRYIRLNRKGDLPEKFTIEFDAVLYNDRNAYHDQNYYLLLTGDEKRRLGGGGKISGDLNLPSEGGSSLNTSTPMNINDSTASCPTPARTRSSPSRSRPSK